MPINSITIDNKIRAHGNCDSEGNIKLNPKKGDVVNTIIHEELHAEHWDMPHAEVYKKSDQIESKMSLPEMAMKLLEAHAISQSQSQHKRDWTYTTASKVIKSVVK